MVMANMSGGLVESVRGLFVGVHLVGGPIGALGNALLAVATIRICQSQQWLRPSPSHGLCRYSSSSQTDNSRSLWAQWRMTFSATRLEVLYTSGKTPI